MRKIEIDIGQIDNGWLLTIEGDELEINVKEKYFETFLQVLEYLKRQKIERV